MSTEDFITKLFAEALGEGAKSKPGVKVVTGKGLDSLLELLEAIGGPAKGDTCGEDDCPIHGKGGLLDAAGEGRPYGSTIEGLNPTNVTPEIATDLAIGAALGSQTKIERGKYDHAERMQEQSFLWMRLAEILREQQPWQAQIQETIRLADAKLANAKEALEDADEDKQELRAEISRLEAHRRDLANESNARRDRITQLEHELEELKASSDPAE